MNVANLMLILLLIGCFLVCVSVSFFMAHPPDKPEKHWAEEREKVVATWNEG